jgi:hypothetical protein
MRLPGGHANAMLFAGSTLLDRLVSFWQLADTHDSTLRNTLTATNTPTFTATGGKPKGNVTLASASSQYLTLTNANCVGMAYGSTGSFSISFFMKPTAVGLALARIIGKGGSLAANAGFYVGYRTDGKVQFQLADGSVAKTATGASGVSGGTWAHIVCVCDRNANNMYLYQNGALVATTSISGLGSITNTANFFMSGTPTEYNGVLSSAGLWSRALTSTEVTMLYNGNTGLLYPFAR